MRTANKGPTGTDIEIQWTVEQCMPQSIALLKLREQSGISGGCLVDVTQRQRASQRSQEESQGAPLK